MKLFKVTTLFFLPVMLSGCGGGADTATIDRPDAARPSSTARPVAAKPKNAKAERGKVEIFKEAGLQFTVPKGWKFETPTSRGAKGDIRSIVSRRDLADILLVTGTNVPEVVDSLNADLRKSLRNYKEGTEETKILNGMKYKYISARGDDELSGPMIISKGYLQAGKPVFILISVPKGEEETSGQVFDGILKSMKKI